MGHIILKTIDGHIHFHVVAPAVAFVVGQDLLHLAVGDIAPLTFVKASTSWMASSEEDAV